MFVVVVVLLAATPPAAASCDTQTGDTIFDDTFQDDKGGWDLRPPQSKIVPPRLLLAADPEDTVESHVLTFNAGDGDYCAEFSMPQTSSGTLVSFGLVFWATRSDTIMWHIFSNRTAQLSRYVGGWSYGPSINDLDGLRLEPGAVNTIRVLVDGEQVTLLLNEAELNTVRVQRPKGPLLFGVFSQLNGPRSPGPVEVTRFRVTGGRRQVQ
jgi:hypothetical protein